MSVAAEVMLDYVKIWAENNKIADNLHISLCSIWIEGERRPAVRLWAFKRDFETILWLEDEMPNPKYADMPRHLAHYGTLDYYCATGGYMRAPTKTAGLVKLCPVQVCGADKATNAARRYALSPLNE